MTVFGGLDKFSLLIEFNKTYGTDYKRWDDIPKHLREKFIELKKK